MRTAIWTAWTLIVFAVTECVVGDTAIAISSILLACLFVGISIGLAITKGSE